MLELGLFLVFALAAWKWLGGAYVHKGIGINQLRSFIETLLVRGNDGGLLVVRLPEEEDERFLQFVKYVRNGSRGLKFAFPDSAWSANLYSDMGALLDSLGVPAFERFTDSSETRSFLVDLAEDIDTAAMIAEAALRDVFGVSEDAGLRATFHNMSPRSVGPPYEGGR